MRICMARAYMGAFWNRKDCRGADGSVIDTLRYGAVVGIVDGSTLRYIAVVEIGDGTTLRNGAMVVIGNSPHVGDLVWELLGRDVASITCRVLMALIFYPLLRTGMLVLNF